MIFAIVATEIAFSVVLVGSLLRASWGMLMKFPCQPILNEHIRRNFQSFSIGICNLGGCVHTVVDDNHLHLIPVKFMTWFGCKPISIPWAEIKDHPKPIRSKRSMRVKIGNLDITGPRWCLECKQTLAPLSDGKE